MRVASRRYEFLTHPDKGCSEESSNLHEQTTSDPKGSQRHGDYLRGDALRARTATGCIARPRAKVMSQVSQSAFKTAEKALLRLKTSISLVPRDQRHAVLASLPRRVSQILLVWMQSRHPRCGDPVARESNEAHRHEANNDVADTTFDTAPDDFALALAVRSGLEYDASRDCSLNRRRQCGIKRVGGGSHLYQASVCCANLLIASGSVDAFEDAIAFRAILKRIRHFLSKHTIETELLCIDDLAQKLCGVMETSCRAMSIETAHVGITLTPWVSARQEIGRKIYGRRTGDIRAALSQRAELLEAKRVGWPAMRSVWVEILMGRHRRKEAEIIADAAWSCHALRRTAVKARRLRRLSLGPHHKCVRQSSQRVQSTSDEHRDREFAAAVLQVQHVIDAEDQLVVTATRAKARAPCRADGEQERRRVARRCWAVDPSRTTEELLAGPPCVLQSCVG